MSDSVTAMFNIKEKFAVATFFVVSLLSPWCHGQDLKPIRVSLSLGAGQLGLWVTRDAGLFAKYGLDAELVGLQSAPRQIQLLLSGETLFASTSGTAPMRARIEGADTIFTMGVLNSFTLSVVAVPEIKDARDLKGKILVKADKEFAINVLGKSLRTSDKDALTGNNAPPAAREVFFRNIRNGVAHPSRDSPWSLRPVLIPARHRQACTPPYCGSTRRASSPSPVSRANGSSARLWRADA